MFQRQRAFQYPENSLQSLWRYFPAERLLDLLQSKELYFTHIPSFADGLEGTLSNRSREDLARWFKVQNKSDDASAWSEVRNYEKAQQEFYASCWHMNNVESFLMWKAYAERGFAVKTTYERVQASFDQFNGSVTGGIINYIDYSRGRTPVGNVLQLVVAKDLPYSDEREFRLLLWQCDPKNVDICPVGNGVRVPVNVRMLIERVYVNPLTEPVQGALLAALEQYDIPVENSRLKHRVS